jgi:hypothetical protein
VCQGESGLASTASPKRFSKAEENKPKRCYTYALSRAENSTKKLGYTEGELSWVLEDNLRIIRPILLWGGKPYRTYRLYQLSL